MEFADKRSCIENIKDEVHKLHPLLENILPKLPNVKSFEYTHGQFERGADFIVQVENATTRRTSHVGVVVKCGKVSGGKVPDVEEQIRECAEERAYRVMNRVRCTEVWVFSSGGYSERTKEKLQARFPGRNVEFFGPEDIAKFVDDYYPYFWHDLPRDLGVYLQQLSSRLHVLDRASGLLISPVCEDLYIELDTYERVKKTYARAGRQIHDIKSVDLYHEVPRTNIGLLEAEMGFGKSKLARRLALSLCNAESYFSLKVIPVFSSFKDFVDKHAGNLDTLVKLSLGSAAESLEKGEAKVLVILDGLDECSTTDHTSASLFDNLTAQASQFHNYRILVTSRPLKSLVDKATLYNEARIFGIRPLSLAKIVGYLEEACSKNNLPDRLFEDLKRSPLFRQLPHSPIAAALFSNLLTQSQQEVPQSLTELYSKSTELMLGRWEQRKELATEKQFKTAQIIAENLAAYFVENRLIYVAKSEVDQIICEYLEKRNIGVEQSVIDVILFERSNLFRIDDDSQTVAFRHRSFAEYLCAHKKSRDRSLSVAEAALDPYWTNVFYFYAGTLLDCPEVLSQLRVLKAQDETQEWIKFLSVPNYLLAAYQTEFEEVESNVMVVLLETARLFQRVSRGETETRLKELTEMQLLYLFKSIVVENLGYQFFNRGFEAITWRIDDCLDDAAVKRHAIFFLGCAALECGNDAVFRFLIERVGAKDLPLSISLAIECELKAKTNIEKDGLLRYHKAKLRKLLECPGRKGATEALAMRSHIHDLFEKRLSARRKPLLSKS